ncbi:MULTISPECIES: isocitrate/isopropylmalate family dehydrogenase [Methanobacterium]|jgi:3-isopropylmalate dehydrogenase|uniref:Isocitrate dehydrogenase n=1 Tax=Methanobacterium subterraneum TaxID=59277 RepID=A0A2H4VB83_9EURY|nr:MULTISPECIES: isocitrate/isopropylmalate family dehydrogenase [Methanobacterium]MBW4256233.1 NAD-dependent isocitrate dehydrogenase [Methanobacterium sp. YSL]PKL73474.1 MAG: isocitrate dehydrogenase [Methanobacteriales archaeon HGW-Methanobacteriales-2]AUB55354.1 isocitrate dehydrogenase [Methanobacterium subterraneum]AUB57669.1 isocitrate dehydrogenase [Methanobacterium sp. MZ-A1]AUB60802.1 isocitrate dehydrogenase [Methanobacterium subterraneum]
MYKIAVIPGDGIGKEVMEATLHVLEAIDVVFDYTFADAGDEYMEKTGVALPRETVDIVKASQACLFGAAGESAADVIVKMRQELDLYVNLRPVKSYPGTKCIFDNLDFVIVRENTEGLYIGLEEETEEGATATRVVTRKASERICKFAFEYTKKTGRKKVTAVHKANVLKKTDGLFKETFYKVAEDYPDMELDDRYVDATAMFFITKPEMFDVIVTTNLFGDILSDEGAGLVGGLGLIPSANIGENQGLFEPVHGSAPRLAGKGVANPSAMILSAVMMLDYLDENNAARKLENALVEVLAEGKVVTGDLGGSSSTMEMAAEVRSKLEEYN